MNVLITGAYSWDESQKQTLTDMGIVLDFQQFENDETKTPEKYDAVVCNNLFRHNNPELFTNLKLIQLTSAGIDEKLKEYTDANGIILSNAKDVYSIPIAETALMQLLNIYKNNKCFIENQKNHIWQKDRGLIELFGKTALVVGFGSIGKEIAKRLSAFGVDVSVANRSKISDEYSWVSLSDLDSVAANFDMVIVSIAACAATEGIIGEKFLSAMKNGSAFVNIARGQIVDEEALIREIESGKFRGVALDVMQKEPLDENSPLWDFENVYITPHNSFVSDGVRGRMFNIIKNSLESLKKRD